MGKLPVRPSVSEKVGKKIDYVVTAYLGPALARPGFNRKARSVWREIGDGSQRSLHVVNIQGSKWNEGSSGSFCINLGVQFPALHELIAMRPGKEWMREWIGRPDEAACTLRARVDDVLPSDRQEWWPQGLRCGCDHWFKIDDRTDLDALGDDVTRLVLEYALPWIEREGDLTALFEGNTSSSVSTTWQVAAGILLGRSAEAAKLYLASRDAVGQRERLAEVEAWLESIGLSLAH